MINRNGRERNIAIKWRTHDIDATNVTPLTFNTKQYLQMPIFLFMGVSLVQDIFFNTFYEVFWRLLLFQNVERQL